MNKILMRMLRQTWQLALTSVALFLCACATPSTAPQVSAPLQPAAQMPAQRPVDLGETTCKEIARDLTKHDYTALDAKLDTHFILERVSKALISRALSEEQRHSIETKLDDQIRTKLASNNGKDSWVMLKGHADGERYLCLVRSDLTKAGVSYIEFDLRSQNGRLQIVDWYDLVQEARISDSFAELFGDIGTMLKDSTTTVTLLQTTTPLERVQYMDFLQAVRTRDPAQVGSAYDRLPPRFQQTPLYAMMVVNIASGRDDFQYQLALQTFARKFGLGNHYGLLLADYYLDEKRYDKAMRGVRKFQEALGTPDPVLELVQAIIEQEQGHSEAFYAHCLQALEANAAYERTYWTLLDQLIVDRHYDDAVLVLNVLTNLFNFDLKASNFEADDKYQNFRKSEAFRAWSATRA